VYTPDLESRAKQMELMSSAGPGVGAEVRVQSSRPRKKRGSPGLRPD